jgi:type I restriction enzyme S subunit
MKYGKMPPRDLLCEDGFPIFSGYRVTGSCKEYLYSEPQLVVVARGVGGTGDVKISPPKSWITNLSIVLDLDESKVCKNYLLYKLGLEPLKDKLNTGAAQAQITIESLKSYSISIPDIKTQKDVVRVISAYDDLIENNRRRIQLLEQSARLLYKQWFVRFRFPGHERVKIKNGVPEGWEKRQVKHLLTKVQRPIKIKTADYLPFAAIPCIDQSRDFIGGYTDRRDSIIDIAKPVIVFGDHTRIVKFVDFPFACGADGTQLIVSNDESISQVYLYFALTNLDLSNYFYARHFKFLKDQYIPIPATNLLNQFTEIAGSIMKLVGNLRAINQQLARARDLLLPRLMNGEIIKV